MGDKIQKYQVVINGVRIDVKELKYLKRPKISGKLLDTLKRINYN